MATMAISQRRTVGTSKAGAALWAAQAILALVFLFAGGMKLAMPLEMLAQASPLPALFMKFIGLCEVTGAAGLILPGLLRIRTELTSLAASGLALIMIGATLSTLAFGMGLMMALLPLLVGLLSASVVYGRRRG